MSLILPDKPSDNSKQTSQLVRISGMGTELAAAIIGMTLIGYLIDRFGGTSPWGVLGGAAVGILGGGYNFIKQARKISRDAAEDFKRRHPHGFQPETPAHEEEADAWEEKWEEKWGDKPEPKTRPPSGPGAGWKEQS